MAERRDVHLEVKGMTCQGCVNAVTRVVQRKDPGADVQVTLEPGFIQVKGELSEAQVAELVEKAGFTPRPLS